MSALWTEGGSPRSHSQHGEDIYIHALLGPDDPRWVVDVGANDGQSWSNSYFFGLRGYDLLLVEPMPDYAEKCRALYRGQEGRVRIEEAAVSDHAGEAPFYVNQDVSADLLAMRSSLDHGSVPGGDTREITVKVTPLRTLLERHGCPTRYALLTVDAEGFDPQVLRSAALERWRPRVVCVEDEMLSGVCAEHLSLHGYVLRHRLGPNGIYVLPAGL